MEKRERVKPSTWWNWYIRLGNVVCIEKGNSLTYDIKPQVRLIRADEFMVDSYPTMAGFVCGIMAGDYDCTDIFVDSITKLCGKDNEAMAAFFSSMEALTTAHNLTLTATVSEIPEELHKFVTKF